MKKLLLLTAALVCLNASEIEVGKGTFYLKGGFAGLNKEISTDVTTYSLVEQHKNIFSSNWFYRYEITWIKSNTLTQAQSEINYYINMINNATSLNLPEINYKVEGLDANFVFGRDILKSEKGNLGIGLLAGISIPWIKNSSSNSTLFDIKETKTKISTYKIGVDIFGRRWIFPKLAVYANGSYAYQTGKVKNDYLDTSINANGHFEEYEIGLRFQPVSFKKKIGFLTISPKLYFTAGYRYSYWELNDIKLDILGIDLSQNKTSLQMKNSVGYVGIGYSF